MKPISIKDIAKRAGVSISTASYALNGVPKVSKETRERVLQIAKELNYRPNSFAKSLKTRKTHVIGLFVSHMDSPYYFEIIQGIDEELRDSGYDFIIAKIMSDNSTGYSMIQYRRIDAAIVLGGCYVPQAKLREIAHSGIPLCMTDCHFDSELLAIPTVQWADIDNAGGIRSVLDHLWGHGHREIAYMGGTDESYDAQIRKKAFMSYFEEKGAVCPPELIMNGDYREDVAFSVTCALLRSGRKLPDAICCANDQMAIGVLGALKSAGIAVPEQIAVTGFDNIRQVAFGAPALTTVDRNDMQMGRILARNLVSALKGGSLEKHLLFEVRLMVRDSCGKTHQPEG
jgi:LacI family transcriptional regulator